MDSRVNVHRENVILPTYEPAAPDRNPMFLDRRVYQGSSGRVYPLPFTDRIAEAPTDRGWDAITLDNGLVEVMLLPEIGGRIHAARDLTNGFDFIYRQHVIKPALVGLAGSWISGGIEFNWPQHHRPSTFMPTDVSIEEGSDGSVTVWMSEHEPMSRMKGMHGICLYPGRSVVEINVRLYNRTPFVQTFLWWANMGIRVHEGYQSFFPPDVCTVADHAKRTLSTYPLCDGRYYGVDYGRRGREGTPPEERPSCFVPANSGGTGPLYAPNDLRWYANIPVPTSYMCLGSKEDFFGGYDHFAKAGIVHVADHTISPGKKQWTWGNHEFGYSWDRNLTDADGPYIELMAGVFTDNQPDFSFLMPGETKVFSQFLYPYQEIGPVEFANVDAAIALSDSRVGVAATRPIAGHVRVEGAENRMWDVDLVPGRPFVAEVAGAERVVLVEAGREVARYERKSVDTDSFVAMKEPPAPSEIANQEELYLTGLHLEQYRHATRSGADDWREALARGPLDVRCNNALGLWHLRRGEFETARALFAKAIERLTTLNPNPYDGEPFYNLGLALRFLGRDDEATEAFSKSVWNAAWQAAGYHALGELACKRGDAARALEHLDRSIRKDADNFRARCLRSMVLRKLGRDDDLTDVLALDPLDWWARWLSGEYLACDNATRIDLVIDLMRAGLFREALELTEGADRTTNDGTVPMAAYYEAFLRRRLGEDPSEAYERARGANPDYCFPSRLEDIAVLDAAPKDDPRAPFYLGNLMYDRRRREEATALWRLAVSLEPTNAVAHRNLGIAAFNVEHDVATALNEFAMAIEAAPDDARLWYERDQLWKRVGTLPELRLAELRKRPDLVARRDDLTIEFCNLLLTLGLPEESARLIDLRRFQPWEGGEGMVLRVFVRTHLALGRRALQAGDTQTALGHMGSTVNLPPNLGEARHILANASDAWLGLGDAFAAVGDTAVAETWYRRAAEFRGDFQEMSERVHSEMTYYQAQAMRRLGSDDEADRTLADLVTYAEDLLATQARTSHFATSMPTMLLFEEDEQQKQTIRARFLLAQAFAGLDRKEEATTLLEQVLVADPSQPMAKDLLATLDMEALRSE